MRSCWWVRVGSLPCCLFPPEKSNISPSIDEKPRGRANERVEAGNEDSPENLFLNLNRQSEFLDSGYCGSCQPPALRHDVLRVTIHNMHTLPPKILFFANSPARKKTGPFNSCHGTLCFHIIGTVLCLLRRHRQNDSTKVGGTDGKRGCD